MEASSRGKTRRQVRWVAKVESGTMPKPMVKGLESEGVADGSGAG